MASPAPTAPVCSQHCVSPASGFVLRSLRLKAFAPALPRAALQLAPGKIPSCDLDARTQRGLSRRLLLSASGLQATRRHYSRSFLAGLSGFPRLPPVSAARSLENQRAPRQVCDSAPRSKLPKRRLIPPSQSRSPYARPGPRAGLSFPPGGGHVGRLRPPHPAGSAFALQPARHVQPRGPAGPLSLQPRGPGLLSPLPETFFFRFSTRPAPPPSGFLRPCRLIREASAEPRTDPTRAACKPGGPAVASFRFSSVRPVLFCFGALTAL